jgi:hypothetical protein
LTKAGLFFYEADVKVWCAVGCSDMAKTAEDGSDFAAGLLFSYDFNDKFVMRTEWER